MSGEGVRQRMGEGEQKTQEPEQEKKPELAPASRTFGAMVTNMDSRWRNWWIRGVFTFVLIGGFALIIYMGPVCLSLLVLSILLKCFQEIVSIGYSKYKEYNLPLIRVLNWYFLLVATYFLYGDNFFFFFPVYQKNWELLALLAQYHRIICFFLYVGGFVLFVACLKKDYYSVQFSMFGWTHLTMFMLGSQAYLIIQNVFTSVFWFLLPVSMVICNDIMAYVFGFFFGRTRLIKLSPKKTWEGFLGAFFSTVIFGFCFAYILAKFDFFTCYESLSSAPCIRSSLFIMKEYKVLGLSVNLYPAQLHSFPLSIFASLLAPFGGFFASGFKRAFNIKDFADVIPGHGGIMDRFDCQILMATFSNVYYFTFCRSPNPDMLMGLLLALPQEKQLEILDKLKTAIQGN